MHATLTYPAMPYGRFFTRSNVRGYCFGFNGQMKDDEIYGEGNSYTAEYWQYDPRLGRRWNLDPKPIADESNYACLRNSPILQSDPNGDFPFPPFWFWKQASEGLKYVSPITFSPNVTFGTHDIGVGGTFSFGVPKLLPISYRYDIGATYYFKENFTKGKGLETNTSHNVSVGLGFTKFNWMRTDYSNDWGTPQGVGTYGFGNPLFSLSTTNDMAEFGGDGGDRFKYGASINLRFGVFSMGGKIGTGDPGFGAVKRFHPKIGGGDFRNGTYRTVFDQNCKIFDPDQYRMGIAYFGFMGLKIGIDSERFVRAPIQNNIVHDRPCVNSPFFKKLSTPDKLFLQYNTE